MASKHRHARAEEDGSGLIDIAALADMKSGRRLAAIDPLSTPPWGGGPASRARDHKLVIAILGGICVASVGVVGLALFVKVERAESAGVLEGAAGAGAAATEGQAASALPAPAGAPEVPAAAAPSAAPSEESAAKPAQVAEQPAAAPEREGEAEGKEAVEREEQRDPVEARQQAKGGADQRRESRRRRRPAANDLAAQPTRAQVLGAMARIQPRVKRCARGEQGVVTLDLRVNGPRGRISSVEVSGVSGATRSCVASAVRGARFPRFADPRFAIRYPVKL